MKTAVFINDGIAQVILTPENDFESKIVSNIEKGSTFTVFKGSFYDCQGGWTRERKDDASLILRNDLNKTQE